MKRLQQEVDSLHEQNSTMATTNQQLETLLQEARREAEQQRSLADKLQREVERVRQELSGQKQIAAVEENEARHGLEAEVRIVCAVYQTAFSCHELSLQVLSLSHLSLNREGRWGTTDDFTASFLHFFPVLHCPLGLAVLQACPFPDVVFLPLPLSALSFSPFHCALQDGFGQT